MKRLVNSLVSGPVPDSRTIPEASAARDMAQVHSRTGQARGRTKHEALKHAQNCLDTSRQRLKSSKVHRSQLATTGIPSSRRTMPMGSQMAGGR
jgi:hypothetical protein